jgi:hypothetical protein
MIILRQMIARNGWASIAALVLALLGLSVGVLPVQNMPDPGGYLFAMHVFCALGIVCAVIGMFAFRALQKASHARFGLVVVSFACAAMSWMLVIVVGLMALLPFSR